jgi:hypothetical protein
VLMSRSMSRVYPTIGVMPKFSSGCGDPLKIQTRSMGMYATNTTTSALTNTNFATNVLLSAFPLPLALAGIYDEYCCEEVECWMFTTEAVSAPFIWSSAIDLDDASVPTTPITLGQRPGSLVSNGNQAHYHRWQPRVAAALYNGAFAGYGDTGPTWVDCGNTNVEHYGLKVSIGITVTPVTYTLLIRAKFAFRGVAAA